MLSCIHFNSSYFQKKSGHLFLFNPIGQRRISQFSEIWPKFFVSQLCFLFSSAVSNGKGGPGNVQGLHLPSSQYPESGSCFCPKIGQKTPRTRLHHELSDSTALHPSHYQPYSFSKVISPFLLSCHDTYEPHTNGIMD